MKVQRLRTVLRKGDGGGHRLEVPLDVALAVGGVRDDFDALSYTHRREYVRWIEQAKRDETRERRLAKAIEMLRDGVKTPG